MEKDNIAEKISFSWDIHYACNYRCPYCWFHGKWHDLARLNRYLSVKEWMRYWENVYERYNSADIDILGGEPFIYPNFTDLIAELSKLHTIRITTNLSTEVEGFVKKVNCEKVKISPTFHPLFSRLDVFIKRSLLLKENGLTDNVLYLAYPPQINQINFYKQEFEKNKLNFSVLTFWGECDGKVYPQDYTEEERYFLKPFLGERAGERFQLNPKKVSGKLCKAGYNYAVILADGTLTRCGTVYLEGKIGNFFDRDFKLLEKPLPCNSDICRCNEWVFLLDEEVFSDEPQEVISVDQRDIPLVKQNLKNSIWAQSSLLEPPYRVFWNWDILYGCNYNCSYCTIAQGKFPCKEGQEKANGSDLNKWREIWDNVFNRYYSSVVRLSGGEPTIHPMFYEIVEILLDKHVVDLTTNLSFDLPYFLERIKPENIKISASFHPEFIKFEEFFDKVIVLRDKGYHIGVCFVSYPPFLEKIERFKHAFEQSNIEFNISPFEGIFNGCYYPKSYNETERKILAKITGSPFRHISVNDKWYRWKTDETKEMKGRLCRMGQMYAKILPNGDVTRCCEPSSGKLGNIFEEDFKLLTSPKPCEADTKCPCFKAMFLDQEKEWLPMWSFPEHTVYKINNMQARNSEREKSQRICDNNISLPPTEKDVVSDSISLSINRQLVEPYRIFFTWDVHYACNYRCTYCFFSNKWEDVRGGNKYPGIEIWKRIWDDAYKKYGNGHIHFSGGEPFIYPYFIDLAAFLNQEYSIEFDTNLSFDLSEFITKVKPGRVRFAAAFHPEFVNIYEFLDKAIFLKERGYDIEGINFVAYPPHLKQMVEYKRIFEDKSISFCIMPFRGEYMGRIYPQGYTDEERELIKKCDPFTASKMLDSYGNTKKTSHKGEICRMGQMYAKIRPDGTAYRCCFDDERGNIGNLIDGTFSLYDEPRVCEYNECPCWVAMVVEKEKNWLFHWVVPKAKTNNTV